MDETLFVDSGFFAALASPRDEHHLEAQALAALHGSANLVTTNAILLEVGNTLARHDKIKATAILREILDSGEVDALRLNAELFNAAMNLYEATADQTWGLVDCVSFVVVRTRGILRALTFDRHFAQAGFLPMTTGTRRP